MIKINQNEKIKKIHEEGKLKDLIQTLETLVVWGEKAQSSDTKDVRRGRGSLNPRDACKICSSAVGYIINAYPELTEMYKSMYEAGTTTGCEACVDMISYSKTLLHDILSGTGGDYEERQELLKKLEEKYKR